MRASIIDEQKTRNDLKSKRKLLFANFSNNPSDIRLALEIRLLDDRISDLDRNLRERMQGQAVRTTLIETAKTAPPLAPDDTHH